MKQIQIQTQPNFFGNYGYLLAKLPDDMLEYVQNIVDEIKKDFSKAIPYNKNLAGNLERQFFIQNGEELEKFILAVSDIYNANFNYTDSIISIEGNVYLTAKDLWVNFMKKHEFNPPHIHSGVLSFVIWLEMPYSIEDEMQNPSSVNSKMNSPAHFGFINQACNGSLSVSLLPVDRNWNGWLCMFPANMMHFVNPFYTSDEYRITVAGNIIFNTSP